MTSANYSEYIRTLTPKLRWWINQIVQLMILHAKITETEATQNLLNSNVPNICDHEPDWFTRENPFYWAMEILHASQGNVGPFWWHDPELFAKYQEYIKWFNSLGEEKRRIPD